MTRNDVFLLSLVSRQNRDVPLVPPSRSADEFVR